MAAKAGVNVGTTQDWGVLELGLLQVYSDWQSNGMDGLLKSSYQGINPASICSANLPQSQLLQKLQSIEPSFSPATLQSLLAVIDAQPMSAKNSVVGSIQQNGMLPWIESAINEAAYMVKYLEQATAGRGSTGRGRFTYNCTADGAVVLGLGIAFATLAIASGPFAVFEYAIWESIAFWGGNSTVGWATAHIISGCSF